MNDQQNIYVKYMSHCIGLDHEKPYKRHGRLFYRPYRNYYDASPADCEIWEVMVGAGYAEAGKKDRYGGRMYWLTRSGLDWLGKKLGVHIWGGGGIAMCSYNNCPHRNNLCTKSCEECKSEKCEWRRKDERTEKMPVLRRGSGSIKGFM